MGLDEFTLQVALLFYPGFVCAKFFDMLAHRPRRRAPELLVSAFVFGVTIHLVCGGIAAIFGLEPLIFAVGTVSTNGLASMSNVSYLVYLGLMTVVATAVALVLARGYNYKWLNRVGAFIGVTALAPHDTCWAGFFELDKPIGVSQQIRIGVSGRIYEGTVQYYSHYSSKNEVVLANATAYTGSDEYAVPAVYISFDPEIIVESLHDPSKEMSNPNGSDAGKVCAT